MGLRELRFDGDRKTLKILQEAEQFRAIPSETVSLEAIAISNQPASSNQAVQANQFEIIIYA